MKITLTFVCVIIFSGLSTFDRSTAFTSKPDSLPPQQRYRFKLASDTSPNQTQWATVFFYPSKSRSGHEIRLPLGVNQTTLRLSSGDRVLEVDEDYVFIANANRIRVLDDDALTAQHPIRITYEGIATTVNKRLIVRYRP